jgi:hypothetical protein
MPLPEFKTVDANADGSISKTEAAAVPGLTNVWADADRDQSGSLSSAEYDAARHAIDSGAPTSPR